MYNSLLAWCRLPVKVHKYQYTDINGDAAYAAPYEGKCYRVDEMRNITDRYGTEYVSHTTVYLPPDVVVAEDDRLSFEDGRVYEIRKLQSYFDGNSGALSLRVAYL